jgi:hypothetical protein
MNYGEQVGFFVYGGGINIRAFGNECISRGLIVVYRDGYATIHKPFRPS